MIRLDNLLHLVPRFERFYSVEKLQNFIADLQNDEKFRIKIIGKSEGGIPLHHIQYGHGSVRALFVAFPHPHEPIGGLTVVALLTLLQRGATELLKQDVQWHVVPCIDPDGAILNEGWNQREFDFRSYLTSLYLERQNRQIDTSFPIRYKKLVFETPRPETQALMEVLSSVRPHFYYGLHNQLGGGANYYLNHELEGQYYRRLRELLKEFAIPFYLGNESPYFKSTRRYDAGIYEQASVRRLYDYVEGGGQELKGFGATSWEYLEALSQESVTFVSELPYVKHPSAGSTKEIDLTRRELLLRADAERKCIRDAVYEEWERVKDAVDRNSPFYDPVIARLPCRSEAVDKMHPQILLDVFDSTANHRTLECEKLEIDLWKRFHPLCEDYQLVRLLEDSTQSAVVELAQRSLKRLFGQKFAEITEEIEISKFEVIPPHVVAKVQLGSGLIVLDSLLGS
jgi:hypothetical protein